LALVSVTGCASQLDEELELIPARQSLSVSQDGSGLGPETGGVTVNGLTTNGLTTNGLTTNGLTTNGLTTNGLTTNGLTDLAMAGPAFAQWFSSNPPEYSEMVMRYLVTCAVPSGQVRTYLSQGVVYTWTGGLGLAPGWASGAPATEAEQQLITACLAAHANKYGLRVQVSVQGRNGQGALIPLTPGELVLFSEQEACFFGNVFNGEGVYSGSDRVLNEQESTARACGLSSQGPGSTQGCAPIVQVGNCSNLCTRDATSKSAYGRCTVNGKSYLALTTRLRAQDIYRCGDGVCQFTESCGNSNGGGSCRADCGTCTP
jgi:hypothetical protein